MEMRRKIKYFLLEMKKIINHFSPKVKKKMQKKNKKNVNLFLKKK